eukprot:6426316-Amphidinium_carterae.1
MEKFLPKKVGVHLFVVYRLVHSSPVLFCIHVLRRFDLDSAGEAYGLLADRKIAGRAIVTIH